MSRAASPSWSMAALVREMSARDLANDHELQQRLLGVQTHDDEADARAELELAEPPQTIVYQVRRQADAAEGEAPGGPSPVPVVQVARAPTRWTQANPLAVRREAATDAVARSRCCRKPARRKCRWRSSPAAPPMSPAPSTPRAANSPSSRNCLEKLGLAVVTVDLSTSQKPSPADVGPAEVARFHPKGAAGRLHRRSRPRRRGDGRGVRALHPHAARSRRASSRPAAPAAPRWRRRPCGRLPVGVPKVMVSTVASGNVKDYVGPSDICMMYSVTDVQGINRISEQVLSNAAHALAGMIAHASVPRRETKPRHRPHHVRRHHALRADGGEGAGGAIRLPGLPRHRHRRPVDGEAGRFAACSPASSTSRPRRSATC